MAVIDIYVQRNIKPLSCRNVVNSCYDIKHCPPLKLATCMNVIELPQYAVTSCTRFCICCILLGSVYKNFELFNPTALRTAKTLWSFGSSECNRVKILATICRLEWVWLNLYTHSCSSTFAIGLKFLPQFVD